MTRTAADALREEATSEKLFVEQFGGEYFVANAPAVSFIKDAVAADEFRGKHEELKKRFDRLELRYEDIQVELSNVRARVSSLEQSQTAYTGLRHLFLS